MIIIGIKGVSPAISDIVEYRRSVSYFRFCLMVIYRHFVDDNGMFSDIGWHSGIPWKPKSYFTQPLAIISTVYIWLVIITVGAWTSSSVLSAKIKEIEERTVDQQMKYLFGEDENA